MNAIEQLKADHQRVNRLFEQVKDTPKGDHPALFKQIYAELLVHTHVEETVFYPQLIKKGDKSLSDITREGIEEHRQAKMFLTELNRLTPANKQYEAKLTVLMEDIEHHVKEEESDMFKQAEDQFTPAALDRLGIAMEKEKTTFVASLRSIEQSALKRSMAASNQPGPLAAAFEKAKTVVAGILPGNGETRGGGGATDAKARTPAATKRPASKVTTTKAKSAGRS